MIYVRGFNTVARTVRYCYRISRFPRVMIICGKRLAPSSFAFLFFLLSVEPGVALNSHVAAEEISYNAVGYISVEESFPKSRALERDPRNQRRFLHD